MGWLHMPGLVVLLAADAGTPVLEAPRPPPASPQLLAPIRNGARVDPTGTAGAAAPPGGEEPLLRPAKDGSGDLLFDSPGFSARVAPDGAVTFSDKRTALSLIPFRPTAGPQNVPSLQRTITGLLRKGRVPPRNDHAINEPPRLGAPVITPFRPDPREACRECSRFLDSYLPIAALGFDMTDEVMRLSGQDPYRYEKARFLVGTRELRVRKAAQAHAQNLRAATGELPRRLETIACDTSRPPRERRQIIEALRGELDGATAEARRATDQINRFLSRQFPTGDDAAASPAPGAGDGGPPLNCPAPRVEPGGTRN